MYPRRKQAGAVGRFVMIIVAVGVVAGDSFAAESGPIAAIAAVRAAAKRHDEDAFRRVFDVRAVALTDARKTRKDLENGGVFVEADHPRFGDRRFIASFEEMVTTAVFEGECDWSDDDVAAPWNWPAVFCMLGGRRGRVTNVEVVKTEGSASTLRLTFTPTTGRPARLHFRMRKVSGAWRVVGITGLEEANAAVHGSSPQGEK